MDRVQDRVQSLVRIKTIYAVIINFKLDPTLSNSVVRCWYQVAAEALVMMAMVVLLVRIRTNHAVNQQ